MGVFNSNGVNIHYHDEGTGDPVVLIHGFGSNARLNWGLTGWFKTLAPRYRVLAVDCRGHGESDKPHEPAAYSGTILEDDVIALLDHLGIKRGLMMGYSMGARVVLGLLAHHPERIRAAVLGGIGASAGLPSVRREAIVAALLAPDQSRIEGAVPRTFRDFAEANHNDLRALAACMGANRTQPSANSLANNQMPVLVVVGSKDDWVSSPEDLTNMISGAQLLQLEGRGHLNAPGDRRYKEAVLKFFASAPE